MHDTVRKVRKRIAEGNAPAAVAGIVSRRLQETGIARALAEPLAAYAESVILESYRWLTLSSRLTEGTEDAELPGLLGDLIMSSRHLGIVLTDLDPFLERVEDNLVDHEEATHRESKFEREVAPFSRVTSADEFRAALERLGVPSELTLEGAQVETDLLKLIYVDGRFREEEQTPADMTALVSEWRLDIRRHLLVAFGDGSPFLTALRAAAERL